MTRKVRQSTRYLPARYWGRSIEALEGTIWEEPAYDSYVVTTVHKLRRKPLETLTDEELRLALGQRIGLPWTLWVALDRLKEDPFRHGDFYAGDLLIAALRLPHAVWEGQRALRQVFHDIVARAADGLSDESRDVDPGTRRAIMEGLRSFKT